MLVSETSIFSSGSLTVRISSMNGTELSMKVSPDQTVDSVKFQVKKKKKISHTPQGGQWV